MKGLRKGHWTQLEWFNFRNKIKMQMKTSSNNSQLWAKFAFMSQTDLHLTISGKFSAKMPEWLPRWVEPWRIYVVWFGCRVPKRETNPIEGFLQCTGEEMPWNTNPLVIASMILINRWTSQFLEHFDILHCHEVGVVVFSKIIKNFSKLLEFLHFIAWRKWFFSGNPWWSFYVFRKYKLWKSSDMVKEKNKNISHIPSRVTSLVLPTLFHGSIIIPLDFIFRS